MARGASASTAAMAAASGSGSQLQLEAPCWRPGNNFGKIERQQMLRGEEHSGEPRM